MKILWLRLKEDGIAYNQTLVSTLVFIVCFGIGLVFPLLLFAPDAHWADRQAKPSVTSQESEENEAKVIVLKESGGEPTAPNSSWTITPLPLTPTASPVPTVTSPLTSPTLSPISTTTPGAQASTPTSSPDSTASTKPSISSSRLSKSVCPAEMVFIPVGEFCLDAHEVTNAAYKHCAVATDNSCTPPKVIRSLSRNNYYENPEFGQYPVIQVSWHQANDYCQFVGKRLSTEAEWELALQDLEKRDYPNDPTSNEYLEADDTKPVESFELDKTPEGVYDLAGNVREWLADAKGIGRLVKGESFASLPSDANSYLPDQASWDIGFRCAFTPEHYK
jgi:formylglycine-generating enzyme required for sulfatase activity